MGNGKPMKTVKSTDKSTNKRPAQGAFCLACLLMMAVPPAVAGDLIYQPRNPSFGGDPFNSSHLLGLADRQNQYDEEQQRRERTPGEDLVRRLESSISSAMARQAVDAILGEGEGVQDTGTIRFGEMTVDFFRGVENIELTITDENAGTETEVNVPLVLVE